MPEPLFTARACATLRAAGRALACLLLVVVAWAEARPAGAAQPLLLDSEQQRVALWAAVRWWHDESGRLDIADAQARLEQFVPPDMADGTLGVRRGAAWLVVSLRVAESAGGVWMFESEHASVQRLSYFLLDESGDVLAQGDIGALERRHARVPTAALQLAHGRTYQLLLRAESDGPLILPLRLSQPPAYLGAALASQSVQAMLAGLSLALLAYSLSQAWWHRKRGTLHLKFALLIATTTTVSLAQFGLAGQYLWPGQAWALRHGAGVAAMLAQCASYLFVEAVLRDHPGWRGFSPALRIGAVAMLAAAVLFAFDVIGVRGVGAVAATIGLLPGVLGGSRAWRSLRRGEALGGFLLLAWLGYYVGIGLVMGVSFGFVPATPWALHAFQAASLLDLGLYLQTVLLSQRRLLTQAEHVAGQLRSLAETDPLTGLLNRRGLAALGPGLLARAHAGHGVALYVIDLDGFKGVNDRNGHAVGDRLLQVLSLRLRSRVRQGDLLARLGGDEFVLLAEALHGPAQARELGGKLFDALAEPLIPQWPELSLGLTVGAVFVQREAALDELIARADAAMYRGKQAGRGRLELEVLDAQAGVGD